MTSDDLNNANMNCSGSKESDLKRKNSYDPSYTVAENICHGFTEMPSNVSCDLSIPIPAGVSRLCKCKHPGEYISVLYL